MAWPDVSRYPSRPHGWDSESVWHQDVVTMARFGRDMLNDSMTALQLQDLDMALEVKSRKTTLQEQHDSLEDRIFTMIALYQTGCPGSPDPGLFTPDRAGK